MENYLENYVINGGPLMALLIPTSVLLFGAIIQSMIRLRASRITPGHLATAAAGVTGGVRRAEFARMLSGQKSPGATALRMTLKEIDLDSDRRPALHAVETLASESGAWVADEMYDRLGVFSTIFTVSPLIGLMGTVLGMIEAFAAFSGSSQRELTALSDGIQQALVTTLWGLGIAIPAYVAAHNFQNRIRRYERELIPAYIAEIVGLLFADAAPAAGDGSPREAHIPQARADDMWDGESHDAHRGAIEGSIGAPPGRGEA